jgi:aminomethyltransferase
VPRKLVGLTLPEKAIARSGYGILKGGEPVGRVTSGTFSPSLQSSVALGYVPPGESSPGSSVDISIRGKSVPAIVVKLPFLQRPA